MSETGARAEAAAVAAGRGGGMHVRQRGPQRGAPAATAGHLRPSVPASVSFAGDSDAPPPPPADVLGARTAAAVRAAKEPYYRCRCSWRSTLGALLLWAVLLGAMALLGGRLRSHEGSPGPGAAAPGEELPEGCRPARCAEAGAENFGALLGSHEGVAGYSNCNADTCISRAPHHLTAAATAGGDGQTPAAPLYTGMKWQCVEYARRYWALRGRPFPAVFGDVDGAADMWGLRSVAAVADPGRRAALARHPNGGAVPPAAGDLLIYPRAGQERDFPYGHVAAVVWVGAAAVRVAEQNWDSRPWPPPFHNYSREIPMRVTRGDTQEVGDGEAPELRYTLVDGNYSILGWLRYGE